MVGSVFVGIGFLGGVSDVEVCLFEFFGEVREEVSGCYCIVLVFVNIGYVGEWIF